MAPEKILVIDGEMATRSMVSATLRKKGYSVEAVESLQQGLHSLEQRAPYLVIAELLPERGAMTLLDRVEVLYPGTAFILLATSGQIEAAVEGMRCGACDVLLKPLEAEGVEASVLRALKHGEEQRQNAIYRQGLEQLIEARTRLLRQAVTELERSYDITLQALGDALDLKDSETEGHSRRVTAYTIALAGVMGVPKAELRIMARGAFLHDIGKMAIPDAILLKPGKLDSVEQAKMREHCRSGYLIVRKIPYLKEAAEIVYSHQEHFDGTGYPRGLKREEIPLGARIFSVADTLDAITSDRPYRKGKSFLAARDEILRCAGTQFDPEVVDAFLGMSSEIWEELRMEIIRAGRSQEDAPKGGVA